MKDQFGREIKYLRISVTDRCNLRCRYCIGATGIRDGSSCPDSSCLPIEQMAEIAGAAAPLGVTKVRITGGEPLMRRGVTDLVRMLADIPEITDLAMTTNGILLPEMAAELKAAGLMRVNISLDTLDPEKYRSMTRLGRLEDTLAGIQAAAKAGLAPLKINTVLIGGFNDDEIPALIDLTREEPIELRFIELMPIGAPVFQPSAYIPCSIVTERDDRLIPCGESGTARLYRVPGYAGRVGLISPLSKHFCGTCDRIRLTADGRIKPCLHSAEEIDISNLHGEALTEALCAAIYGKPAAHGILDAEHHSASVRGMDRIGG